MNSYDSTSVERAAKSPLLQLAAYGVALIGVPLFIGFFWKSIDNYELIRADINDMKTSFAVMEEKVISSTRDRYPASQANNDLAIRDERILRMQIDIERLNDRIQSLEKTQ